MKKALFLLLTTYNLLSVFDDDIRTALENNNFGKITTILRKNPNSRDRVLDCLVEGNVKNNSEKKEKFSNFLDYLRHQSKLSRSHGLLDYYRLRQRLFHRLLDTGKKINEMSKQELIQLKEKDAIDIFKEAKSEWSKNRALKHKYSMQLYGPDYTNPEIYDYLGVISIESKLIKKLRSLFVEDEREPSPLY